MTEEQTEEGRVLLRTADVYQTLIEDDVNTYSERLLAIVADFHNSGAPEGYNAQSMVGKSKKGEVACRYFARINPATGIVEAAGFKARGCLAMTGCASALCEWMEGKPLEDVLAITVDDVTQMVDGVPSDKKHAVYFAVCAARGLVGDFLLRDGSTVAELDNALPCDQSDITCLMAEHCSLRQSRMDCLMEEEDATRAIADQNAMAEALELIRQNTRVGRLTTKDDFENILPAHRMDTEFASMLAQALEEPPTSGEDLLEKEPPANSPGASEAVLSANDSPAPVKSSSPFANRAVGVPNLFANNISTATAQAEIPAQAAEVPEEAFPEFSDTDPATSVLDTMATVYDYSASDINEDEDFELVPPEGFELVEVDGQWGLVPVADAQGNDEAGDGAPETAAPKPLNLSAIRAIQGPKRLYFYDSSFMKPTFLRWAYLTQEGDDLATFAYCVREESRVYPRPMAEENFANRPFQMNSERVNELFTQASATEGYEDIQRSMASNGEVYYYSTKHLAPDHAQSLVEWHAVERFLSV